jgi:hypothetical protein
MAGNTATLTLRLRIDDNGAVKVLDGVGQSARKAGDDGKRGFDRMGGAARKAGDQFNPLLASIKSLVAAYVSLRTAQAFWEKGFFAVDTYQQSIASLAAMVMTFMENQNKADVAGQWEIALKYSSAMVPILEQIAAKTLLSGEETTALANAFARSGVFLDASNQKQIEAFTRISNALPLMTQGQEIMRQINTEIRAAMTGANEASSMLLITLKSIDPQIENHLKFWRQQGTVLENIGALLSGFGPATSLLENQWQAVKSTLDTTVTQTLRGGFLGAYADIIASAQGLDAFLNQNKDTIGNGIAVAWSMVSNILGGIWGVLSGFGPLLKDVSGMVGTIAYGWGGVFAVVKPIGEFIGESIKMAYSLVKMLGHAAQASGAVLTGRFAVAKQEWEMAKAEYQESVKYVRSGLEIITSGVAENIEKYYQETSKLKTGMDETIPKIKGMVAETEEQRKAAEHAAQAIDKVIAALQWEIQAMGLSEDAQFRLTKLREAGVEADSKAGREILKYADALLAARREMELSEEVDWFLADEREQAAKNLKSMGDEATRWIEATRKPLEVYQRQLEEIEKLNKAGLFGEGDVGADNYARARQKALDDYVSANYKAASEIDEIWENTRNRIQDALAGVFADMASGELDSIKDYMAGIGRASGEIFAAHLSQAIMEGINSSQFINDLELVFNDIFGTAFSGDQIAAGILGTLSASIAAIQSGDGGRMAGTGAGAGLGLLLSGGNPMGMALGASAGGMIGGMFGDSGPSAQTLFMQGLRDVAEELRRNTEALQRNLMEQYPGQAKTAQLAADTFDTVWEAINGKVKLNSGALGSIMPANMQGIAALAAPGNRTDAYRQYLGAMSDIAPGLYDGMDPEAMGGRIKKHLDTFFDYIFEVASNSIAQIQEQAMQWADTIGADLDQWASRLGTGPTAAEKAMADYTDKTLPYLSTINDQAQGLTAVLETVTDPAQRAMIQERIDQLWGFADAIQRLGPAITEFYAGNRADILAQMDRDINPLPGLDAALADVTDRGEAYRDQLVDNGMAVAEAEERTRAWTEAMKDAVREEMIGNAERDLTIRLLRAQGNEEAALNMEREGQIEALRRQFGDLSGPLEDIARQIWAIEDAARGLAAATSAVESARAAYMSAAQRQLSSAQAGQAALESRYDEAKSAYVAALQQKIEAENAANQSRINSLNASAQAAGRAASEVERMADTFGRIVDQIRDYRRNLLTGDSLIGVESRYKTARSEFEQAVSGIYSTDLAARQEALSKLPQMAGTFLEASKGVNASPGGYQQDLARVLAVLNTAEGMAEVGKSNAEKQLESALARQATLERQASMMSTHTSIYQKMLDEVEQDQADTRTFEQIQQEYLEAKAAFDHSSFTAEIEYWQAEIDRLDTLINATESVEAAFSTYSTALVNAIAGGYDDLKGSFAAELAALKDAAAIAPDGGTKAAASFSGGGTISGPAGGYTVATTFHGTEHITPDSQMAEVTEVLADVRGVLIQIRDTAGAINLTGLKSHRILDRATQGGDKVRVVEAA